MARFVARRLLGMIAVLFAISVIVFLIFNVIPNSDPAARIAGKNADPALIARVTADLGLDKPLPVQYLTMMKQIFTGQLTSYAKDRNVLQQIWDGLPATFSLCIGAAIIWMALAIIFGYLSAVHAGRFTDRALTILALVGISMQLLDEGLRSHGIATSSLGITRTKMNAYRSAFLTNSSCAVRPVAAIDDVEFVVDDGLTRLLEECYEANPWQTI